MSNLPVKKPAPNAGKPRPDSILVRRARVARWIADRAAGMTVKQIAARDNVAVSTIHDAFRWAEREGFFDKADEAIRNRLVPLAIDAVERKLLKEIAEGDAEAALKVLMGVRLLSNGSGPTRQDLREASEQIDEAEMTWERFTIKRKLGLQKDQNTNDDPTDAPQSAAPAGAAGAESELPPIDAEVIREERSEVGAFADPEEPSGG